MPILSSTRSESVQQDGRIYVHEQHTDHTGFVHDVYWRAPAGTTEDELQLTMQLRAANIGEAVAMRERAEAEAHNFAIPLTQYQFLGRFTVAEYAAVKAAATQSATLDYYWQKFMTARGIYLDDASTVSGVTLLEQAGLIAAGRAAEILA